MEIKIKCEDYNNRLPIKWVDADKKLNLVCYKISKETYEKKNLNTIIPEFKNGSGIYIYQGIKENKEIYYIGRSTHLDIRTAQKHGINNWNTIILITSVKKRLDLTKIAYLENQLITIAKKCHGAQVVNRTNGDDSYADGKIMNLLDKKINDLKYVLCAMGSNVIALSPDKYSEKEKMEIYFCDRRGSSAEMVINKNGKYVVRKNSIISKFKINEKMKLPKTMIANNKKLRDEYERKKIIKNYILLKDIEFESASAASRFVTNSSSNGLNDWKNYYGIKLGEYIKKIKKSKGML